MDPFHLMCALAVRAPFERVVLPMFAGSGGRVEVFWGPTTIIQEKLAGGEKTDAVLLTTEVVDALVADGTLDGGTRMEVATSRLGVAVPCGHQRPDLSSEASFRQALLDARSVAFSRAGASGIYFAKLIERMGIAEPIRAKATIIPAGFTAEKLVSGEADLAVQQISELMAIDGIDIVGPFPEAVQTAMRFSAAVVAGSSARASVVTFLETLGGEKVKAAFRDCGLDPVA
jgi:molybdate transport system substrate-binding protein